MELGAFLFLLTEFVCVTSSVGKVKSDRVDEA